MAGIAKRATVQIPINVDGLEKLDKVNQTLNRITQRNSSFKDSFAKTSEQLGRFNDKAQEFGERYSKMMESSTSSNREFAKSSKEMARQLSSNQNDIQESIKRTQEAQKRLSDNGASGNESLGRSHESLGHHIDNNTSKIEKMDHSGHSLIMQGMNMTMTMAGVSAGAIKAGKNALGLQNEYIKVQNLAVNGGEKQQEVQRNMNSIQKQGSSLAQRYGISQNDISEGYEQLIRRGYTTSEALGSQNSLLKASIASGDDYKDVVNNAGDAIDQFGLRTNNAQKMAQNTKTATNQMAYSADLTATNFQGMGYALKYVGSTAHTAHQSLSDTSSAIGILSNNGQDASVAGTGLRSILNSLISVNNNKSKQNALQQMGLGSNDLKDSHGNLKSLDDLFKMFNQHTQGMNGTQRTNLFHQLFGTTGQESASILSQNQNQLSKLNQQVDKSQNQSNGKGYTSRLSQQNMQSTQKQLDRLVQAVNGFAIDTANQMLPTVKNMAHGLSGFIGWLDKLGPTSKKLIGWGAVFTTAIGPVVLIFGGLKRSIASVYRAFAGLRRQMGHAMPTNASDSISSQALQNEGSSVTTNNSSSGNSLGSLSPRSGESYSRTSSTGTRLARTGEEGSSLSRDASETGNISRSAGKLGTLSKLGGVVSRFGDIATLVSVATPLLSMLDGKNITGKTSNVAGTALSSFIPGIGPLIAPIIGHEMGKYFNDSGPQRRYQQLDKQGMVPHPSRRQNANNQTDNGRDQIMQEFSQTQLQNSSANSSGYSKTRKNLLSQNQQTYSRMEGQLSDYNQKTQKQSDSNLNYLKRHHLINNNDILNNDNKTNNKNVQNAQKALQQLSKNEFKNGNERNRARRKAESAIAKATSNGSDQQKIILGKLRDSSAKISDKTAGKQISSSYKSMRSTIKSADSAYNQTTKKANARYNKLTGIADQEYYAHHKISKKKYDDLMKNAEDERKGSVDKASALKRGTVKQAQDQHSKVVSETQRQSSDHLDTLNTETGQALGKWQWLSKELGKVFRDMFQKFLQFWQHPIQNSAKGIASWINNNTSGVGNTSQSHQKLMKQAGIPKNQWGAYNNVINRESSWQDNRNNGDAVGLGQLKGSNNNALLNGKYGNPKSPVAQLKATKAYMGNRYNGNATNAVRHEATQGWYGNGGWSSQPSIFGEVSGQPEVAINPQRNSADDLISQAINARAKANASSKWANIAKSQANNRKTANLQNSVSEMMNNQSNQNSNSKPINITQNITVNGNTDKNTTKQIGQQTKQAVKQVIDEYFTNKNSAIFNS